MVRARTTPETISRALLRFAISCALALAPLYPAPAADDWKFDVLHLKNGSLFKGMLLDEKETEIRFSTVHRNPGALTRVFTSTYQRNEITSIDKLALSEREVLQKRLKALDPNGNAERGVLEGIDLKKVPWLRKDGDEAFRYDSAQFVLVSNAREDIVRRAAWQLEQVYAAYARFLPPRLKKAKPTTIFLVRSLAEYQTLLKDQGRDILNPAFFIPARNEIYCACELQDIGDKLERVRKTHQEILDQLKSSETKYRKQFNGKIPAAIVKQIEGKRREVNGANQKNDVVYKSVTRQLFQTLYHEAFHAYLANFVYPPDDAEVPRWLNEGLAQIFETAIVEAGELRVGHVDPDRLTTTRNAAHKGELLPIADLLESKPQQFLVRHASERKTSDRHYFNSWALAHYLTFDRRLLGTAALDRYVEARKRGTNEKEAFRALVGKPLPQFEKEYVEFLSNLRSDGASAKKP